MDRFKHRAGMRDGSQGRGAGDPTLSDRQRQMAEKLMNLAESASPRLALEIKIPVAFAGKNTELTGTLEGHPAVRRWECYEPRFSVTLPFSSGLSVTRERKIDVLDWAQALADLGAPTSISAGSKEAHVTWREGQDALTARVSAERLVEAGLSFEVRETRLREPMYAHEGQARVFGDLMFDGIGMLTEVELARCEMASRHVVYPAAFTKVGAVMAPEDDRQAIVAALKARRKTLPLYDAERKLSVTDHAMEKYVLKQLPEQLRVAGIAKEVTLRVSSFSQQEEVTAHYGSERWGTGNFVDVTHQSKFLVCDGIEIDVSHVDKSLGGAFPSTADAVVRDFLEWGLACMKRGLDALAGELAEAHIQYYGELDPAIYADFDWNAHVPAEEPLRLALAEKLKDLNRRVEEARAAAAIGMERTDPAKAERMMPRIADLGRQFDEMHLRNPPERKLERYAPGLDEKDTAVWKLLRDAREAQKAKNYLKAAAFIEKIEVALASYEAVLAQAEAGRRAYFEHKSEVIKKAEETRTEVSALKNEPRFSEISRDLYTRVKEAAEERFVANRFIAWTAADYEKWNERATALITEVKETLSALPQKDVRGDSFSDVRPVADPYPREASEAATEYVQQTPEQRLEAIFMSKDRAYAKLLKVSGGTVVGSAGVTVPESMEDHPQTIPIGKSGRYLAVSGSRVTFTYASGNTGVSFTLPDGLFVISRDAGEVIEVRSSQESTYGLSAIRFVSEDAYQPELVGAPRWEEPSRAAPSVTPALSASMSAKFGDKFKGLFGGSGEPAAPEQVKIPSTPARPMVPAPEIKKEAMTEDVRQNLMHDLMIARDVLESLRNDLPSIKAGNKPTDLDERRAKLRKMVVDRLTDARLIEEEVKKSEDVASARGKVGDIVKRSEKAAQEIARVLGGQGNLLARYKEMLELIPEVEAEWGGSLSEEGRGRLVPRLMALAKRAEEVKTALRQEIGEAIAEEF